MALRPRFSILSLLLLATIVGLSIALWMTRHENESLRIEIRVLKQEEIESKKATRPIVRKLRTTEPLTWRYRIYLPPSKQEPDGAWALCNKHSYYSRQSRLQAGTLDIFLKITEDPLPDGRSEWHLNIGDGYRTERETISAESARRFREAYKWAMSPQERTLPPNPSFIGLLKSEDVAVWIAPVLDGEGDIAIPSPDNPWFDQQ